MQAYFRRELFPSIYTPGTLEQSDSELDSFLIQNSFRIQLKPVCRSTGRSTDPSSWSTVPVDRAQPRLMPFQSVDWRSTGFFCGRPQVACACWCTPVDRSSAADAGWLLLRLLWLLVVHFLDFLSLPIYITVYATIVECMDSNGVQAKFSDLRSSGFLVYCVDHLFQSPVATAISTLRDPSDFSAVFGMIHLLYPSLATARTLLSIPGTYKQKHPRPISPINTTSFGMGKSKKLKVTEVLQYQ